MKVSVVGSFNAWDGRRNPMRGLGSSGVWEIFLPGVSEGDFYKFEIRSQVGGTLRLKSDPHAFFSEMRPGTDSVVWDIEKHRWTDQKWLEEKRGKHNAFNQPISVYEVHLGSWRRAEGDRYLTYREFADQFAPT